MQTSKLPLSAASLIILFLAFAGIAHAAPFSAVIVYGDSLSDNGNLYAASSFPPAPYYNGRFSNGPIAIEQFAAKLGAPLLDFAWGGATTGIGNSGDGGTQTALGASHLPGMLAEFGAYTVPAALVPNSLFVVWGGANDYEVGGSVATAVGDIDTIVGGLLAKGAKHILVPGLPDLGLTPEFYGVASATQYTLQFNSALIASLPAGVAYDNVYGLLNSIVASPTAYGFTNVTTPCFNGVTVCANPSQYLFWDDIHPTTTADALIAAQFQTAVSPEPSSLVLLGSGIAGLAGFVRRRRAA